MTTYIPEDEIILNEVVRNIGIVFNAEVIDNVLQVDISEDKILQALSGVATLYNKIQRERSGRNDIPINQVGVIEVRIGSHKITGVEKLKQEPSFTSLGFIKQGKEND